MSKTLKIRRVMRFDKRRIFQIELRECFFVEHSKWDGAGLMSKAMGSTQKHNGRLISRPVLVLVVIVEHRKIRSVARRRKAVVFERSQDGTTGFVGVGAVGKSDNRARARRCREK